MRDGRRYLSAKQYQSAIISFAIAKRQLKDDQTAIDAFDEATSLKKEAESAQQAAIEARKAASTMAPAAQGKPAAYRQQMDQGAAHEKAGQYDQALVAYRAALRALANDADAQKKVDFCQAMINGENAMKQKRFGEARAAYEIAVKLFPGDANAKAALQRAKAGK